jgi:hypothetical protein
MKRFELFKCFDKVNDAEKYIKGFLGGGSFDVGSLRLNYKDFMTKVR